MERSYSLSCKTTIYIANLFVFEGINYVEHLYKNPNLQHQSFIYAKTNYVQFLFFIFFIRGRRLYNLQRSFDQWSQTSFFNDRKSTLIAMHLSQLLVKQTQGDMGHSSMLNHLNIRKVQTWDLWFIAKRTLLPSYTSTGYWSQTFYLLPF